MGMGWSASMGAGGSLDELPWCFKEMQGRAC